MISIGLWAQRDSTSSKPMAIILDILWEGITGRAYCSPR